MSLKHLSLFIILPVFVLFSYLCFFYVDSIYASTDITSSWLSTINTPYPVASHGSVVYNNKLYIIGGATYSDYSDVWLSDTNNVGALVGWQSTTSLPKTRYWSTTANWQNKVYLVGGASLNESGIYLSSVLVGDLNASGVASWSATTPLPQKSALGAAVVVGNKIYYAGGMNGSGTLQNIYVANINSDGSLGSWLPAGLLPFFQYGFGMVEDHNNLIVLGGYYSGNRVYSVPLDTNGNITTNWQFISYLPRALYRSRVIKIGSQIYSIGGSDTLDDAHPYLNKVYYADLNADGTVGPWLTSSNTLPGPVEAAAAVILNNYLYLTGGYAGRLGYLNSVYYTKLNLDTSLNVPLLKQTDPSWGSQIYDSSNMNISDWGCALTSAAMVFQYNGVTKLPDGTALNPGTLNSWLKSRQKGYIGASINWMELQTLSKLAKPQNPVFTFDALEFKKAYSYDPTQLTQLLKDNIPGILEVDNRQHFLVAKGTSGNTFSINDPFFNASLLTQVHGNTFSSLGWFVPSHSDLSYIELAVDEGVSVKVEDQNGNIAGHGFTDQPSNPDGSNKGNALNFYYVPQPGNGTYKIFLTSDIAKQYTLQTLLYDINGNLTFKDTKGILGNNSNDTFTINFDKNDSNNSAISQNYSYESLLADLDLLYAQGLITNYGAYNSMKTRVVKAKAGSKPGSLGLLSSLLSELDDDRGTVVLEDAWQILSPEVNFLLNSLK